MNKLALPLISRVQLINLATILSFIFGIILRFWSIDLQGSFVFDELILIEGSNSLNHLFATIRLENIPPLYWFLSYLWFKVVPISEFNARLLSVIFSIGTIPAVYLFARKILADRYFTAAAVMLVSFSPFFVLYAGFARPYGLLSLLSIWFVYESWQMTTSKSPYRFILSGWLLSLTHLFGAVVVSLVTLTLILLSSKKQRSRSILLSLITHIPLLIWLLIQLPHRLNPDPTPTWYQLTENYPTLFLLFFLLPFTVFDSNPATILLLLLILVLLYKIPPSIKKDPRLFILLVATLAVPLAASSIGLGVVRYTTGTFSLIILLTLTVVWYNVNPLKQKAAIVGFFLLHMLLSIEAFRDMPRSCYNQVAQDFPPDEIVFVAPPFRAIVHKHYAPNPALIRELEGLYPAQTYVDRIKYNYRQQYTPSVAERLAEQLNPYQSFVLASTTEIFPQEEIILPAIYELGFQTRQEKHYECSRPITLRYFRRSQINLSQ